MGEADYSAEVLPSKEQRQRVGAIDKQLMETFPSILTMMLVATRWDRRGETLLI